MAEGTNNGAAAPRRRPEPDITPGAVVGAIFLGVACLGGAMVAAHEWALSHRPVREWSDGPPQLTDAGLEAAVSAAAKASTDCHIQFPTLGPQACADVDEDEHEAEQRLYQFEREEGGQ
jgi:hypothetical protein